MMTQEIHKPNILVVDDTSANLRLLAEILQNHGYEVRPVPNGKFALRAAQGLPPDLILLDIMMTEIDGYEVCRQLKADTKTQHIPVIFISALHEVIDKVQAFAVGGVDYITKPFQVEEILSRVNTHLELATLQKTLIEKNATLSATIETLQVTQNQLIQTEKMAALGQLIAGIAHEINTPMGAIRSSIENIADFFDSQFLNLLKLLHNMKENNYTFLEQLLLINQQKDENLSTREKRQIKKHLISKLETNNVLDADTIADTLVDLGIIEIPQINDLLLYIKTDEGRNILNLAYRISTLTVSSKTITTATERAAKIVFALKSYSRWELNDAPVTANIVEYLETVLTLYRNEFKKGVQVVKNYTDIPDIICYPDQLNQVWTNLISNAIHAMNNQGTLTFDVGQENSEVKVSITDTGSGIDPSIKDKIFEPFFTTKPRGEGTGLGLDIIKKIIDKHQGRIELTSIPHCTTFIIYLPINTKSS